MTRPAKQWPKDYVRPTWLPDWKDISAYVRLTTRKEYTFEKKVRLIGNDENRRIKPGSLKTVSNPISKSEYAWEFLRRNPRYQAVFQKLINLAKAEGVGECYRSTSGFNIHLRDNTPPPSLVFHAALYRALTRWGLSQRLPDPCRDLHESASHVVLTRWGNDFYLSDKTCLLNGQRIPLDGGIVPTAVESIWLFDISLPLQPQMDEAKKYLIAAQEELPNGKRLLASKTDPKTYINYLRILDADASGADDELIATTLYSDKEPSSYGGNVTPHRDALNHARLAAYELRNKTYKILL